MAAKPVNTSEDQAVTKEQIVAQIKAFVAKNSPSASIKIVLAKPIEFVDGQLIRIPINNKVEISMMQNIEVALLDFLRNGLGNNQLNIEYNVSEHSVERKPYTSSEIFEAMAKKNPALLKLKDDLGLDTEY